ncbi:Type I restriction enzyme EcoR124II R protein [Ferriphaselus amnicola]|uniref:Type I restriction enzyme EcoR124II R protein n=1 Tax=Ferriphaselus amnicola TaxID=1188319 RepID=A0A2Z6GE27_9PROT|nr:type I restriction endonuclease [Ferriphaselus amnicola]BBE51871.1 Type I restriction enzyme EcoR124II R protein [Ferriphaselus amnicola]
MTGLHKEIEFENDICEHLAAHDWLYAEGDFTAYDRARAVFPADVIAWVQATQPKAWESLSKSHGAATETVLLDRIRKQLDDRGTLDVLRHGIELLGLRQPLQLAQFKPALAMNSELQAKYAANRLRVVRQVRYSLFNENAIDLVLFLNGLPIATVELKSHFTQSVDDAVDQYRFDRHPKPKGQAAAEPLLDFPRGALVHFAVSNSAAMMTTRLLGAATTFLPFNLGDHGAAGNPVNPNGHRTAYLWEQVWARESWLEIIGRYIVAKRDSKKQIKAIIFPRYHQLDATRKLVAAVISEGAGQKYLIQHSAGSGKTNSIAWTAHFLADLHDAQHKKLFDSVLVVSDRTVLDTQLQEAIFDFERTAGVVATIKGESQSKSGELAQALSGGKKIVVCTIQTFPFALQAVRELAATQGKRFAVIADEAHSSQTGTAASKLKQLLSAEEMQELADGGEVGTEDLLAMQMAARSNDAGITYVAFTATPKAKTLELFGRRPNPALPASDENLPAPFHVYSMRQAIEEGFILDVLKNYTPYKLAFKLANEGHEWDEKEVERSTAMKGIMRWVRLHPYNISQKVQVVVEHFRDSVQPLLEGKAKAMVVVGSRLEAVRWQIAIDKYIKSQGYKIGTLVAFSGEVNDQESHPDPLTETSKVLNTNLNGRDIREAFATDEYQILLVANKFQTGFDQPLLCGMYVDKRLAGIQAVQTLSRLNRAYPGKDTTYILDFVNDPNEVLAAFKTYYETAELDGVTDPNLVYDLRAKLDAEGHYDDNEVDRVVNVEMNPHASQAELSAAIEPVADRLLKRYRAALTNHQAAVANKDAKAEQEAQDEMNALMLFKRNLGAFQRVYAFLSQIFDYGNTAIEKRAIFFKRLLPLLEFGREREGVDLSKVTLTHHKLKDQGKRNLALVNGEYPKLSPLSETGSGEVQQKEKVYLAEIITKVNELFEGELTDDDKLIYVNHVLKGKLLESEILVQQANNNTKEQFANSPDLSNAILSAIMDALSAHSTLSKQALDSEKVRSGLKDVLLGPAQLYEALRAQQVVNG